MKTLKYIMLVVGIGFCGQAMAQEGLASLAKKVKTMRDSMVVKGVDRRYIDVPEQPWQIIVRSNVKQTIVSMDNEGSMAGQDYSVKPYLKTTPSHSIGLWAGYRGFGLGYSMNLGGDKGSNITLGAMGQGTFLWPIVLLSSIKFLMTLSMSLVMPGRAFSAS